MVLFYIMVYFVRRMVFIAAIFYLKDYIWM